MTPEGDGSGKTWTAIVLAGQRPGPDRLATHFGTEWKALVPIGGEAMLTRVVRTLSSAPGIGRTIVLAQDLAAMRGAAEDAGSATLIASSAGISESVLRVAGTSDAPWPVLVTTADHPLLTPAIVADFLEQAGNCDVAVGMVERQVMRAAYPDNERTWLKFADGHWSGANLFALNSDAARGALKLWSEAEQDRKKAWKLFLHFGPWLAFRALTRTIGLGDAMRIAGKRLGLVARLVPLKDAEAAIDVDKPSDHSLAEDILARRKPR
ncbi:MAG: nucleotidyltransferase family protein [Sphingomonadales bacterium]|nr:nucleotidyltransferase family protein [Sphingomonadales bacterium]